MREPDSQHLDVLLRSAARTQRTVADEERVFSDVWSRVQSCVDDGDTTSGDVVQQRRLSLIGDREVAARRRRRATRLASAALAIAVAGGGTAVAADFISTRTGQELTGWEIEAGGTGEVLNLGGTDRAQVFDEMTRDIPFPPGYEAQRSYALEFHPSEVDHAITEGTLRSWMARIAVCTWADAWVAADDVGDLTARAAAATTLVEAVSWEDIRANDHPDSMDHPKTGERRSYNGWIPPLAAAAQAGDRPAVLDAVAYSAACSHHVLPVIDTAPDYIWAGTR